VTELIYRLRPFVSASSTDNEYIPAISIPSMKTIVSQSNITSYIYNIGPSFHFEVCDKMSDFINRIFGHRTDIVELSRPGFPYGYYAGSGYVYYFNQITLEFRILMLLCARVNRLKNVLVDTSNVDDNDFCVLVNNSCINDEGDHLIYRNVKRAYLDCINKEVDILYTNNLMNLTFKSSIQKPMFKNVIQMSENNKILQQAVIDGIKHKDV
jgi:hypothetical protein